MIKETYEKLKKYSTLTFVFSLISLLFWVVFFVVLTVNFIFIFNEKIPFYITTNALMYSLLLVGKIGNFVMSILILINYKEFDKYTKGKNTYLVLGILMFFFSTIVGIIIFVKTKRLLKNVEINDTKTINNKIPIAPNIINNNNTNNFDLIKKLESLNKLLEDGYISKEEYDKLKSDIINKEI